MVGVSPKAPIISTSDPIKYQGIGFYQHFHTKIKYIKALMENLQKNNLTINLPRAPIGNLLT